MLKLALVGRDVSASISPQIHSFILGYMGESIAYDKLSVSPEKFGGEAERILDGYDGLNVTIPYKLEIMPHLRSIEGDAKIFGAVNTVVCASRTGYNTDGEGFMQMLEGENVDVNGRSALVVGVGGAGRSVAKKLSDGGAAVTLYNRTYKKAQAVADEFGKIEAVNAIPLRPFDIIVNASGVGMHESVGLSPVKKENISLCGTAVDLIYRPAQSEFLRIAASYGKKTVNGVGMLFYQAYYSDCYFLGAAPSAAEAEKLYSKFSKEFLL